MFIFIKQRRKSLAFRGLAQFITFLLVFSLTLGPSAGYAQNFTLTNLPAPGVMVTPSVGYVPLLVKGITIHPDQPLRFDFIVDTGNSKLNKEGIKEESERLIKYFLAALTIPENDLWVNLSPYEKDRLIPEALGQTELGRDLLAQDYILKQLTATMIDPEKDLGKDFWARVYKKAQEKFGTTDIPIDTFNKVWILPDKAKVFERDNIAYVIQSRLKVMVEEDYLAWENEGRKTKGDGRNPSIVTRPSSIGSDIIREIIIPEIEKEVNEGKNFAPLRQIYHSLILAKWFKETIKENLYSKVYINKNKTLGVDVDDKTIKNQIYDRYIQAYKKGVFNYIKEETDPVTQESIPRKYFSGGTQMQIPLERTGNIGAVASERPVGDFAMVNVRSDPQKIGEPRRGNDASLGRAPWANRFMQGARQGLRLAAQAAILLGVCAACGPSKEEIAKAKVVEEQRDLESRTNDFRSEYQRQKELYVPPIEAQDTKSTQGQEDAIKKAIQDLKSNEASVRMNAANSLSKIGGKSALPYLQEQSKFENDVDALSAIFKAIQELESKEASLVELLDDVNNSIVISAMQTLQKIGANDKDVISALAHVVTDKSRDYEIRHIAINVLMDMGAMQTLQEIGANDKDVISALTNVITDPSRDYEIRRTALNLLKNIGKAAVPDLIEAFQQLKNQQPDASLRIEIIEALGDIGEIEAADFIQGLVSKSIKNTNDYDYNGYYYPVRALGKIYNLKKNPAQVHRAMEIMKSLPKDMGVFKIEFLDGVDTEWIKAFVAEKLKDDPLGNLLLLLVLTNPEPIYAALTDEDLQKEISDRNSFMSSQAKYFNDPIIVNLLDSLAEMTPAEAIWSLRAIVNVPLKGSGSLTHWAATSYQEALQRIRFVELARRSVAVKLFIEYGAAIQLSSFPPLKPVIINESEIPPNDGFNLQRMKEFLEVPRNVRINFVWSKAPPKAFFLPRVRWSVDDIPVLDRISTDLRYSRYREEAEKVLEKIKSGNLKIGALDSPRPLRPIEDKNRVAESGENRDGNRVAQGDIPGAAATTDTAMINDTLISLARLVRGAHRIEVEGKGVGLARLNLAKYQIAVAHLGSTVQSIKTQIDKKLKDPDSRKILLAQKNLLERDIIPDLEWFVVRDGKKLKAVKAINAKAKLLLRQLTRILAKPPVLRQVDSSSRGDRGNRGVSRSVLGRSGRGDSAMITHADARAQIDRLLASIHKDDFARVIGAGNVQRAIPSAVELLQEIHGKDPDYEILGTRIRKSDLLNPDVDGYDGEIHFPIMRREQRRLFAEIVLLRMTTPLEDLSRGYHFSLKIPAEVLDRAVGSRFTELAQQVERAFGIPGWSLTRIALVTDQQSVVVNSVAELRALLQIGPPGTKLAALDVNFGVENRIRIVPQREKVDIGVAGDIREDESNQRIRQVFQHFGFDDAMVATPKDELLDKARRFLEKNTGKEIPIDGSHYISDTPFRKAIRALSQDLNQYGRHEDIGDKKLNPKDLRGRVTFVWSIYGKARPDLNARTIFALRPAKFIEFLEDVYRANPEAAQAFVDSLPDPAMINDTLDVLDQLVQEADRIEVKGGNPAWLRLVQYRVTLNNLRAIVSMIREQKKANLIDINNLMALVDSKLLLERDILPVLSRFAAKEGKDSNVAKDIEAKSKLLLGELAQILARYPDSAMITQTLDALDQLVQTPDGIEERGSNRYRKKLIKYRITVNHLISMISTIRKQMKDLSAPDNKAALTKSKSLLERDILPVLSRFVAKEGKDSNVAKDIEATSRLLVEQLSSLLAQPPVRTFSQVGDSSRSGPSVRIDRPGPGQIDSAMITIDDVKAMGDYQAFTIDEFASRHSLPPIDAMLALQELHLNNDNISAFSDGTQLFYQYAPITVAVQIGPGVKSADVLGVDAVVINHSETREYLGVTSEMSREQLEEFLVLGHKVILPFGDFPTKLKGVDYVEKGLRRYQDNTKDLEQQEKDGKFAQDVLFQQLMRDVRSVNETSFAELKINYAVMLAAFGFAADVDEQKVTLDTLRAAIIKELSIKAELEHEIGILFKGLVAKFMKQIWLAYEPIEGIKGTNITPALAKFRQAYIRQAIVRASGDPSVTADSLKFLYGGGANEKNIGSWGDAGYGGAFIGRASAEAESAAKISAAAQASKKVNGPKATTIYNAKSMKTPPPAAYLAQYAQQQVDVESGVKIIHAVSLLDYRDWMKALAGKPVDGIGQDFGATTLPLEIAVLAGAGVATKGLGAFTAHHPAELLKPAGVKAAIVDPFDPQLAVKVGNLTAQGIVPMVSQIIATETMPPGVRHFVRRNILTGNDINVGKLDRILVDYKGQDIYLVINLGIGRVADGRGDEEDADRFVLPSPKKEVDVNALVLRQAAELTALLKQRQLGSIKVIVETPLPTVREMHAALRVADAAMVNFSFDIPATDLDRAFVGSPVHFVDQFRQAFQVPRRGWELTNITLLTEQARVVARSIGELARLLQAQPFGQELHELDMDFSGLNSVTLTPKMARVDIQITGEIGKAEARQRLVQAFRSIGLDVAMIKPSDDTDLNHQFMTPYRAQHQGPHRFRSLTARNARQLFAIALIGMLACLGGGCAPKKKERPITEQKVLEWVNQLTNPDPQATENSLEYTLLSSLTGQNAQIALAVLKRHVYDRQANTDTKKWALSIIGEIGTFAGEFRFLVEVLKDDFNFAWWHHAHASWAIYELIDKEPHGLQIAEGLLNDPDQMARISAVNYLGHLETFESLSILVNVLLTHSDPEVRYEVTSEFEYVYRKEFYPLIIPPLITALLNDVDDGVRAGAADALGGLGDPSAVQPLITAMQNIEEFPPSVRSRSAHALGEIGDPSAIPALISTMYNDPERFVRWYAIRALGAIGDSSAIPDLINVLQNNTDYFLRAAAAESLGFIGDTQALPALQQALNDPNPFVRDAAQRAIDRINRQGSLIEPKITPALEAPESPLRSPDGKLASLDGAKGAQGPGDLAMILIQDLTTQRDKLVGRLETAANPAKAGKYEKGIADIEDRLAQLGEFEDIPRDVAMTNDILQQPVSTLSSLSYVRSGTIGELMAQGGKRFRAARSRGARRVTPDMVTASVDQQLRTIGLIWGYEPLKDVPLRKDIQITDQTTLEELRLPKNMISILKARGRHTVGDLLSKGGVGLDSLPEVGPATVQEVNRRLAECNIMLPYSGVGKDSSDRIPPETMAALRLKDIAMITDVLKQPASSLSSLKDHYLESAPVPTIREFLAAGAFAFSLPESDKRKTPTPELVAQVDQELRSMGFVWGYLPARPDEVLGVEARWTENTPIADLGLTGALVRHLQRGGANTVADILERGVIGLEQIPDVGPINQIDHALAKGNMILPYSGVQKDDKGRIPKKTMMELRIVGKVSDLWHDDEEVRDQALRRFAQEGDAVIQEVMKNPHLGPHILPVSHKVSVRGKGHFGVASVGIAVTRAHFQLIWEAMSQPKLSKVPANFGVDEMVLDSVMADGSMRLVDILADIEADEIEVMEGGKLVKKQAPKPMTAFIEANGEGPQQYEVWAKNPIQHVANVLRPIIYHPKEKTGDKSSGVEEVHENPIPGADGAPRIMFKRAVLDDGSKVFIEFVDQEAYETFPGFAQAILDGEVKKDDKLTLMMENPSEMREIEFSALQLWNEAGEVFRWDGSMKIEDFKVARATLRLMNGNSFNARDVDKVYMKRDAAMIGPAMASASTPTGGIDVKNIQVERDGPGMTVEFDQKEIQNILQDGVDGFAPMILNIQFNPAINLFQLLGLEPANKEEELEISSIK